MTFLDPDRRWFSSDKWEHGGIAAILGFALAWFLAPLITFVLVVSAGIVYELGQWDAARGAYLGDGKPLLGRVGYGFSLLDLAWDTMGAFVGVGLCLVLK